VVDARQIVNRAAYSLTINELLGNTSFIRAFYSLSRRRQELPKNFCALTALVCFGIALASEFSASAQQDSDFAAVLTRMAAAFNSVLPERGERGLRWDKVTADVDHRRLIYTYSFENRSAAGFTTAEKEQFLKDTRSHIVDGIRRKIDWPLEHGCTYVFMYYDKDGVYLLEFSVALKDLK